MKRRDVYQMIDGERDYQDALPDDRTDHKDHSVGDYLTMMNYYLSEANRQWTLNYYPARALDIVRKLAGIAVHCMEDHEAPPPAQVA